MAQFSEFLYALRKEKNLTQSELAEKLGITNKAVSKWETGEAMPDTAQLLPLSEIFGVSVDELLRGERNTAQKTEQREDRMIFTDGEDTVEIKSDGSIYVNQVKKEHRERTVLEKIAGCICGSLMAIAIIVYVALGAVLGLWHPLWCIPASAALGCGIVCCTFDLFDRTKKAKTWKEGDNPYTGSLCGIIMCASLIIFLCVASVLNMWNIMWISPAAGGCACMLLGTIGGVFSHKKEKLVMTNNIFKLKSPNFQKLTQFGFAQSRDTYSYAVEILDGQFELRVNISAGGEVKTELIDSATDEPYTLHLVEEASGAFVGAVRAEYERVLAEIAEKCFEREVFKSGFAKRLIEYVRERYGSEPEYLWEKFPANAVWRRKDNQKWYGAILTANGKHFSREGEVEILDLRMAPEELDALVDNKKYFRGWHMNKKHWFTVVLDGSVPISEIFRFLDESYRLAKK